MSVLFLLSDRVQSAAVALVLCLVFGVYASSACANTEVVGTLFNGQVITESRDDEARQEALQRTLSQVIVKVTGQVQAPQRAGSVLARAEALVSQFRFERLPDTTQPDTDDAPAASSPSQELPPQRYRFHASFVPGAVTAALRDAGLTVWPPRRPRTLVLAAVEGQSAAIDQRRAPSSLAGLLRGAEARGIPLTFPQGIVEERGLLDVSNVWSVAQGPLRTAAQRYEPAEILVLRLTGSDRSGWRARLTQLPVAEGGSAAADGDAWTRQAATADAALLAAANSYADRLAGQYAAAVFAGPRSEISVIVTGADTFERHARVLNALRDLAGVESVRLQQLSEQGIVYGVSSRADAARLRAAFGRLPLLVEDRYAALTLDPQAAGAGTQGFDADALEGQGVQQGSTQGDRFARSQTLSQQLVFRYQGR